MCNLYSLTKAQEEVRRLTRTFRDKAGNLPSMPAVFPDYEAPIVRTGEDGERELVKARWGMPTPPQYLKGKKVDKGVTNIRNVASSHWRRWLGPPSRCLVPFTSFSEYEKGSDSKMVPVWFALAEDRPLAFFAEIWTTWTSTRKLAEGETTLDLFGFLTCKANEEVKAVHPTAMPVILTQEEELEAWMATPWQEAAGLQRPLPDGTFRIVARGERKDEAA